MAHSGLVHRFPFANIAEVTTPTVSNYFAAGTDPDTWGFTDNSTGTNGVDYSFDTNAGRSRFNKLTTGGVPRLDSDEIKDATYDNVFLIIDDLTFTEPAGTGGLEKFIILESENGTNYFQVYVGSRPSTSGGGTVWVQHNGGLTDTGQAVGTQTRYWVYCSSQYNLASVYLDDGTKFGDFTPNTGAGTSRSLSYFFGGVAGFAAGDMQLGDITEARW